MHINPPNLSKPEETKNPNKSKPLFDIFLTS